jgi:hypothetical protein
LPIQGIEFVEADRRNQRFEIAHHIFLKSLELLFDL